MTLRMRGLVTIACIGLLVVNGCAGPGSFYQPGLVTEGLSLDSEGINDSRTRYLVGDMKNIASFTYDSVCIVADEFDASGRRIGQILDSVRDLKPGQVWRIMAPAWAGGLQRLGRGNQPTAIVGAFTGT